MKPRPRVHALAFMCGLTSKPGALSAMADAYLTEMLAWLNSTPDQVPNPATQS